mmetsp:Transcript_4071/g.11392  ORF Transcript_4071/g.11392 Transcript_4071/m.11392 type:complete len:263 (-) Transcript_4071:830-1618(-)
MSSRALFFGSAAFAVAMGAGYAYGQFRQKVDTSNVVITAERPVTKETRKRLFDMLSGKYDQLIYFDEMMMGIEHKRFKLLYDVNGIVLETAAGTGRNLDYYRMDQVESVELVDNSEGMRDVCLGKMKEKMDYFERRRISYRIMELENLVYQDDRFDYVVDTFGLCSVENPGRTLEEIARVCKPGGRVHLLEHGRSTWGFLSQYLDDHAEDHVRKWGCFWNRDIEDLVRKSGLRVVTLERKHFGTTIYIIAEKAPAAATTAAT